MLAIPRPLAIVDSAPHDESDARNRQGPEEPEATSTSWFADRAEREAADQQPTSLASQYLDHDL